MREPNQHEVTVAAAWLAVFPPNRPRPGTKAGAPPEEPAPIQGRVPEAAPCPRCRYPEPIPEPIPEP
jgi:hypothetical protein